LIFWILGLIADLKGIHLQIKQLRSFHQWILDQLPSIGTNHSLTVAKIADDVVVHGIALASQHGNLAYPIDIENFQAS
jgi:hypothetical protein